VVFQFLEGEQGAGFFVQINRIVRNAGFFQRFDQLGPDFIMAFLVLGFA
jgi:hypothetical protein